MMEIKNIKGFLVDLDGTVYLSNKLLKGAKEFLKYLDLKKIKYLFFTNNPSSSVTDYVKKLNELGLDQVISDNIITSGQATINYLKNNNIKKIFLLGTESYEQEIRTAGIEISEHDPEAVVLSFDKTLTYRKLEIATHLINAGKKYIATNPDLVCPTDQGPIPDCGAMAALLEKATNKTPMYIGKPHKGMVEAASARLGLKPEEMAIVGDRLYTDMKMGINHKLTSVLVLSGETKLVDLEKSGIEPDFVMQGLDELLSKLQS